MNSTHWPPVRMLYLPVGSSPRILSVGVLTTCIRSASDSTVLEYKSTGLAYQLIQRIVDSSYYMKTLIIVHHNKLT